MPGQFIFGRLTAARELNMKTSSVRNRMEKLRVSGNIAMQTDTHYTIVTICNWDKYQGDINFEGQASGQAKDNQRTTKGQPKDTDKNCKNGEESVNTITESTNGVVIERVRFNKLKEIGFKDGDAMVLVIGYSNEKSKWGWEQFNRIDFQIWHYEWAVKNLDKKHRPKGKGWLYRAIVEDFKPPDEFKIPGRD